MSITCRFVGADRVVIAAVTTASFAACPVCHTRSSHVHSRYLRTVADLHSHGRRVVWRITALRFRCCNNGCPRVVFCERFPDVWPHARASDHLVHAQRDMALAVGGESGSRRCHRLAFPTSGDTLLRRARALPPTTPPTPGLFGVDDFAFLKGHTYGTILVDLERGRAIDLLPDRTAATLTTWLKGHPVVEVISRDRESAYAQAASDAAQTAIQVADRFHLLVNLREAVERTLQQRTAAIGRLVANAPPPGSPPPPAVGTAESATADGDWRQEVFERVSRIHRDGRGGLLRGGPPPLEAGHGFQGEQHRPGDDLVLHGVLEDPTHPPDV